MQYVNRNKLKQSNAYMADLPYEVYKHHTAVSNQKRHVILFIIFGWKLENKIYII